MNNRRAFLASSAAVVAVTLAMPSFAEESRTGEFKGASGHVTSGHATIVTKDGQSTIELQSDFQFDGAPDPKVALGHNGFDKSTILEPLHSNSGKQSYKIPAGIDASKMNEVWIWCEQYSVPLGVAKLH